MILGFRHKGLRLFHERGDPSKIRPDMIEKVGRFLTVLEHAEHARGCDLPGYRLHSLKGDFAGYWSASVSRNHRIVFRFQDGNAIDVDLVDYH